VTKKMAWIRRNPVVVTVHVIVTTDSNVARKETRKEVVVMRIRRTRENSALNEGVTADADLQVHATKSKALLEREAHLVLKRSTLHQKLPKSRNE
jgi:hypothetical protein